MITVPAIAAGTCPPKCGPKSCPAGVAASSALASQLANTWLIFRYDEASTEGDKIAQETAMNIARNIYSRAQGLRETAADFLAANGIDLDSQIRSGLGDMDLDLFYEHSFSKRLIGELMLGFRFPTGGKASLCASPYAPALGNNGHFEIKIGGDIAWKIASWVNLKFDTYYSFVLKNTEKRMAAFQGATIKNFGPCVNADVDWGYYVGRLDFTFFHPKTSDIRSSLGYEFYYKTKDKICFNNRLQQTFLGQQFVDGVLVANLQPLDSCLASKNTESIGHKVRAETSCQINTWFEILAGGTVTFAGQNVFADSDAHAGFNILF